MTKQIPVILTPSPKHSTAYVDAWEAPSRTHNGVKYIVKYDRLENAFTCQCAGYTYRGHCAHIDQAIEALVATWRTRGRGTA